MVRAHGCLHGGSAFLDMATPWTPASLLLEVPTPRPNQDAVCSLPGAHTLAPEPAGSGAGPLASLDSQPPLLTAGGYSRVQGETQRAALSD